MSLVKHLLTEGKVDIIRDKIGLNEEIIDMLVDRYKNYKKYWIVIAHITAQLGSNVYVFNRVMALFTRVRALQRLPNPPVIDFKEWKDEITTVSRVNAHISALTGIIDYMQSVRPTPDLSDKTFYEAVNISDEWHEAIALGEDVGNTLDLEEGQVVVHTYDDGYYWVDLKTNDCDGEGGAMGHCGRTNADTLLSLRDDRGEPHVTIAYNYDGEATQIKGKGNKKPVEKYHTYIYDLILNAYEHDGYRYDIIAIESEYNAEDDFNIFDGTDEQIKRTVDHLESNVVNMVKYHHFRNIKVIRFFEDNMHYFLDIMKEFEWKFPDSPPIPRITKWELEYDKSLKQFRVSTDNIYGFLIDNAPDSMTDTLDNAFVNADNDVINDALLRLLDTNMYTVQPRDDDGDLVYVSDRQAMEMILYYNGMISEDPVVWK